MKAGTALQDIDRRPTLKQITRAVCKHYKVTPEQITGMSKTPAAIVARHELIHYAREIYPVLTRSALARKLGLHHSTVYFALGDTKKKPKMPALRASAA